MKIALHPIAGLIRRHGTQFEHEQARPADPSSPWKPDNSIATGNSIVGVIQQMQPVNDRDIPDGHTRSIAILVVDKGNTFPKPGDHIKDTQNIWRIQTILPIGKTRGDTLVEAIMIGQGG